MRSISRWAPAWPDLAGAALCLLGPVGPFIGSDYIVQAFMVVVLGGVGQLAGTVGAAAAIGGLSIRCSTCSFR